MTEVINQFFHKTLGEFFMVGLFFFGAAVSFFAWSLLDNLANRSWNILIKIVLCVPIWFLLIGGSNTMLGVFFRDFLTIFYVCKEIIEVAFIVVVFFKALPNYGNYVAAFVTSLYVGGQGFMVFSYPGIFDTYENMLVVFSLLSAILSYIICEAVFHNRGIFRNLIN